MIYFPYANMETSCLVHTVLTAKLVFRSERQWKGGDYFRYSFPLVKQHFKKSKKSKKGNVKKKFWKAILPMV